MGTYLGKRVVWLADMLWIGSIEIFRYIKFGYGYF